MQSGWAAGDELNAPAQPERVGPAMMPFLRYGRGDKWWRLSLGLLYVPGIIVLVSIGLWLGFPQPFIWLLLGVLWVGFMGYLVFRGRS